MKRFGIPLILFIVLISGFSYYFFSRPDSNIKLNLNTDDKQNLIVVVSPIKNSEISSPLVISGRARGNWFFEGSFPVVLLDSYRNTIAEGHVSAQGEWTTADFVKFLGSLEFNNYIKGQNGYLVLKKDNASGLPEFDDSLEIPVIFK
jgi:hypothetical protein